MTTRGDLFPVTGSCFLYLDGLAIMADDGRLHAEVLRALFPAPPDGGMMLGVRGDAPNVECAEGGGGAGRRLLEYDWVLGPKDGEDDIVTHHIKVPGDDGALVLVLDENLVYLTLHIGKFSCKPPPPQKKHTSICGLRATFKYRSTECRLKRRLELCNNAPEWVGSLQFYVN